MTAHSGDRVLVILSVPPALEEPIVDWLLSRGDDTGFTSVPIFEHGGHGENLSIAEQVTGRLRRLRFEVTMPRSQCGAFLDAAVERFGKTDVHIVVLPVLAAGAPEAVRDALADSD